MLKKMKKTVIAGFFGLIMVTALCSSAEAISISYTAEDLADGGSGDLWRYTYTVSGHSFLIDEGFTIYFDPNKFDSVGPASTSNAGWDILLWQPDPVLGDGAFDALAIIDSPGLGDPFSVEVIQKSPGIVGSQIFELYRMDSTGSAIPFSSGTAAPVPEPTTMLLLATGLAGTIAARRKRNFCNGGDI